MMRAMRYTLLLTLGLTMRAAAQPHRYLSALEYSLAIPIGATHDYTPALGWSGAVWESRWMDHPHTSIGVLLGFNEFYRRRDGTFNFPAGAATGDQYRHLLMVPLLATGAWYFNENRDDPRWYIGGGGAVFTEQVFRLGLNEQREANWGIALVPEVGLAFNAWYGTGGIIALRYHLPTTSSGFLGNDNRRFQYVSLSMGFGYR
jgi:hypothetical protein